MIRYDTIRHKSMIIHHSHGHGSWYDNFYLLNCAMMIECCVYFLVFFLAVILLSSDSNAFVTSAMSTDCNNNRHKSSTTMLESKEKEEKEEVLQLPEASNDPSIPSIKLGESIKFEEMGPVVINADGSTRQIANWDKMTKAEQEVAWRRISKRNEERRKILLEQQQQQDQMNENKNE